MKTSVWCVVVLAACGHKSPDPVQPPPGLGSGVVPAAVANEANLSLQCDLDRPKANPCDSFNHPLNVSGDRVEDCYRQTNTTDRYETLHFDLRNTSDPSDTIRLQLNNFSKTQASNVYHLDDPAGRYLTISGTEQVLRCVEDQRTAPHAVGVTARSPGNDPSCDSTGCTVQITEPDPAQPDRLTLQVDCPELCEDNSYFICKAAGGGRVRFRVTANCPLRP